MKNIYVSLYCLYVSEVLVFLMALLATSCYYLSSHGFKTTNEIFTKILYAKMNEKKPVGRPQKQNGMVTLRILDEIIRDFIQAKCSFVGESRGVTN